MIRFQIIERPGAGLHKKLLGAMRDGDLRTFLAKKRGREVEHKTHPGRMNWSTSEGIIDCRVTSPRKQGGEWQFFRAFLGRLADRYADDVIAINVQFPARPQTSPKRKKRRS